MKKLGTLILVFMIILPVNNLQAEEAQFHFNNWPLANFEGRTVLVQYKEIIRSENGKKTEHKGVDIAAEVGEEVLAVADGKVYWTYTGGAHGISVGIEHENGYRTTYLHLSERFVKKNQEIKAGEVIGKIGITGDGRDIIQAHLQFDLKDPERVDPYLDPLLYASIAVQPENTVQPEPEPQVQPQLQLQPRIEPPVELSPLPVTENQAVEVAVETPVEVSLASKKIIKKTEPVNESAPKPLRVSQKPVSVKKHIAVAKVRLQAIPVNTAVIKNQQPLNVAFRHSIEARLPRGGGGSSKLHHHGGVSKPNPMLLIYLLLALSVYILAQGTVLQKEPSPSGIQSKLQVRSSNNVISI